MKIRAEKGYGMDGPASYHLIRHYPELFTRQVCEKEKEKEKEKRREEKRREEKRRREKNEETFW